MKPGHLVALATLVSSLTAHAEITIPHAQGETTLREAPSSIAVFDMGLVDSLDALGVPIAGVPKDFLPSYLYAYQSVNIEHIGSLFEPDYEALFALEPDLILIANRSAAAYDDLNALAPTADLTMGTANFLDQFRQRTRLLGEIFDKSAVAEARLAEIDAKVAKVQSLTPDAGEALVLMTSGGRLTAYGSGSRFALLHDELGFASAADDLEAADHGDPVSFEFVLQQDPDYLFVIDRDSAIGSDQGSARATLDNDLIKRTQAYQNGRVVYLDSVNWYIVMSGINAVDAMVTEVLDALQPH